MQVNAIRIEFEVVRLIAVCREMLRSTNVETDFLENGIWYHGQGRRLLGGPFASTLWVRRLVSLQDHETRIIPNTGDLLRFISSRIDTQESKEELYWHTFNFFSFRPEPKIWFCFYTLNIFTFLTIYIFKIEKETFFHDQSDIQWRLFI